MDESKMGLRPKRRPKYKPSDEEDPENQSYSRPNYVKMTTPSHIQQYVSPSVLLNQNAKLLVKFVNKSNKQYRDSIIIKEAQQNQIAAKNNTPVEKVKIEPLQTSKPKPAPTKVPKTQPTQKPRQLYHFKPLYHAHQSLKNMASQQLMKNIKGMQSILKNNGIYSVPLSNQLSQLQSLYPNLRELGYQSLTQPPNPNLFQFNKSTPPKLGPMKPIRPVQPYQGEIGVQALQGQAKSQKIFKRSAYHVAIAYHIYLKKLKQQGIKSGNQLDPTYKAKLIKQKAGMATSHL